MLTLAFDSSSKTVSVSLLRDRAVVYDTIINNGLNHSEVLLPTIDEAIRLSGVALSAIDLFACTLGPGSFTGLRIGVSTLKGLMMATGKPAVGVSTLAALALNVNKQKAVIGPMMDAGRGQVYLAYYRYDEDGVLRQLEAERALNPESITDYLKEDVIYVGDGAIKYADLIRSLTNRIEIAQVQQQYICASAVGILAVEKYQQNDLIDLSACVPFYLRPADALPKKSVIL
jgi:tRNA threonylcarbamoyladenosine biosynthesis protein TsaB